MPQEERLMEEEEKPSVPEWPIPAFPVPSQSTAKGMTIHTCFAMVMMAAEVSKQGGGRGSSEVMAGEAIKHTNALLKALHLFPEPIQPDDS